MEDGEHGDFLVALPHRARVWKLEVMNAADRRNQNHNCVVMFGDAHGEHWRVGEFVPHIVVDQVDVQTDLG